MNKSIHAFAAVAVLGYIAVAALLAVVITPAPKGGKAAWYSYHSWGKHKPADNFDAAKLADLKKASEVGEDVTALVHAAAIEVDKAKLAVPSLPPSPATDVVKRTIGNAAGALNQASPLSASESADNIRIMAGLLSTESAARGTAEAKQLAAEQKLGATSEKLEKATADLTATRAAVAEMSTKLRQGFEERNALANELEAGNMKRNALIALAVLLCLGLLYAKVALSGVGRALHMADNETFAKVAGHINTELGAVGQWAIRAGRVALAKKEAISEAIEKGNVAAPAAPTSGAA